MSIPFFVFNNPLHTNSKAVYTSLMKNPEKSAFHFEKCKMGLKHAFFEQTPIKEKT